MCQVIAIRLKHLFLANISRPVAAAILFIWIASFLDYFLTLFQVSRGALELNPILAPYFHSHQYEKALIIKMALTFPGICILSAFYRHSAAIKATVLLLVVYCGLLVYHICNLFL